jgi:hypothetical protein
MFFAGLTALASAAKPVLSPRWAVYSGLNAFVPFWDNLGGGLWSFWLGSIVALWLFTMVDRFTAGWTKRRLSGGVLLFLLGVVVAGTRGLETLSSWLVAGALLGALFLVLYMYVLRFDLLVIAFGMAAAGILGLLRQALQQAYPGVEIHIAGAVIGVGLAAWWLHRRLAGLSN